ncbi:TPA: hypothetical protein MI793_29310, partial [Klebsiella pneumoniae]|nr:hypothetical protein [Klebsiella pneumoniae]HBY8004013.1 hypothetical protein [Klebsiella pneumoniae]
MGQGMDRTGSQSPGAGKRHAPPGGYSKSAGITEKLTADRPATLRGDITRTETIMMKNETLNTLILRHGDRMLRQAG